MKRPKKKPKISGRAPRRARSQPAALPPLPDPRAMEQTTSMLTRLLQSQQFSSIEEVNAFLRDIDGTGDLAPTRLATPPATPIERAQEIMYKAWNARGARRVVLARQALQESPDCADAYVLLAEETAKSPEAARDLYAQGVAAGERALGAAFFQESAGHFWGLIETRPYMRAREGLAQALAALGELSQAVGHLRELLRLNPSDNQGIRYLLARCLMSQGEEQRLLELLDQYPDDGMAEWLYTRALVLFRTQGQGAAADKALRAALDENSYVPLYLLGAEKLPARPPATYGFGDKNEAVLYVGRCGEAWLKTPGARSWLMEHLRKETTFQRPHHSGHSSPS